MKEKQIQYANAMVNQLTAILDEECDNHLDDVFDSPENTTIFFSAMLTACNNFCNTITGDSRNELEFNHLQNQLFLQWKLEEASEKLVRKEDSK